MTTSSFHPCCDAATSWKCSTSDMFICVISRRSSSYLNNVERINWSRWGAAIWPVFLYETEEESKRFYISFFFKIEKCEKSLSLLTCTQFPMCTHDLDNQLPKTQVLWCCTCLTFRPSVCESQTCNTHTQTQVADLVFFVLCLLEEYFLALQ